MGNHNNHNNAVGAALCYTVPIDTHKPPTMCLSASAGVHFVVAAAAFD